MRAVTTIRTPIGDRVTIRDQVPQDRLAAPAESSSGGCVGADAARDYATVTRFAG